MRLTLFKHEDRVDTEAPDHECIHGVRLAHWDDPSGMGHQDQVSYYTCESCGTHFTREEDADLRPTEVVAQADHERLEA